MLCPRVHCASHRPLLRRNRGLQRDIPHCHIFSDVIDVAPDPKPLRRGPGNLSCVATSAVCGLEVLFAASFAGAKGALLLNRIRSPSL